MESSPSAKPASTVFVNKNVNKEEAMAGLDLLNKHEQAMRRYDQKRAAMDKRGKVRPEWNSNTSAN